MCPETSNGDVGSAIHARPALHVPLHATSRHSGGICVEFAGRFGIAQVAVDKDHSFILGAASCRYPVTHAIVGSINSHPSRVPESLAFGFTDRNAAAQDSWCVQRWII